MIKRVAYFEGYVAVVGVRAPEPCQYYFPLHRDVMHSRAFLY